jgi:hypothetical protein
MEPLKELVVREFLHTPVFNGPAYQLENRAGCALEHRAAPFNRKLSSTYIVPSAGEKCRIVYLARSVPPSRTPGKENMPVHS